MEERYKPISKGDIPVVDEAGRIGTRQMAIVTSKNIEIGANLVLVGDRDQLQLIEAGTPFRRAVRIQDAARLTARRRQHQDWRKQASRELAEGYMWYAIERYQQRGAVSRIETRAYDKDDRLIFTPRFPKLRPRPRRQRRQSPDRNRGSILSPVLGHLPSVRLATVVFPRPIHVRVRPTLPGWTTLRSQYVPRLPVPPYQLARCRSLHQLHGAVPAGTWTLLQC